MSTNLRRASNKRSEAGAKKKRGVAVETASSVSVCCYDGKKNWCSKGRRPGIWFRKTPSRLGCIFKGFDQCRRSICWSPRRSRWWRSSASTEKALNWRWGRPRRCIWHTHTVPLLHNNSFPPAPSGGEEGDGARRGRRGGLHLSGPQDHQARAADRPGQDQEDQRSGVSLSWKLMWQQVVMTDNLISVAICSM